MTRLILWRHGQTLWNADDRVQGQTDVELSDLGREQAVAAATRLAALKPDVLVSSDLKRAAGTAAALAELTGLPVRYDERLRERHFGEWQGLKLTEVAERWPERYTRWRRGEGLADAGVEEIDALGKRVTAALQEAVEQAPAGSTIVVATHGGAARHGTAGLLGWPEAVAKTLGGLANCHWTDFSFDPVRGWQLRAHNVG